MKIRILLLACSLLVFSCSEKDYLVTISTVYGDMKLVLFDETPKHKATFLEFAKAGKYDSTTFHRVMNDFMIQGGDVNSRPDVTEPDNTLIDPEFKSHLIHTKGMLAGARTNNPEKRSGPQFYIVEGLTFTREELDKQTEEYYYNQLVAQCNELFRQGKNKDLLDSLIALQGQNDMEGVKALVYSSQGILEENFGKLPKKTYTDEQYEAYATIGGAPHLDFEYTVYGKVVEGLNVVDSIATVRTGQGNMPIEPIYMTVSVEEISKKKLSKLYGITYPE